MNGYTDIGNNTPFFQLASFLNTLYIAGLFHCYVLDESICHFRDVWSTLSLLFLMEILSANNVDPDQMPHHLASDLGQHCIPITLSRISR